MISEEIQNDRLTLFHTSNIEIRVPDLYRGRKNADFGQGFYLTPDKEFTYRWAGENAVVNKYELDLTGLKVHRFTRNEDWFQYIYQNRRVKDTIEADVIIGPIANDTIFDTFGIISSGYLKPEEAMKLLMIGPEYTQVTIKTQEALKQLTWIRSERIEKLEPGQKKAEEEAYQAAFAEVMQEMLG